MKLLLKYIALNLLGINQPITKRTAVHETRTYGGVRGAPHRFMR
jgi:hypothetical protein